MKLAYYPGCTLKNHARNFEDSALCSLEALGVEVSEIDRWNCCGTVFSLATDDLIHHLAPIRNLIRVKEAGADVMMTLCAMCFNTIKRSNQRVQNSPEDLVGIFGDAVAIVDEHVPAPDEKRDVVLDGRTRRIVSDRAVRLDTARQRRRHQSPGQHCGAQHETTPPAATGTGPDPRIRGSRPFWTCPRPDPCVWRANPLRVR